jgi:hypothetical protein
MARLIRYIDTNNSEYIRTFATTATINIHPHNNVYIDFSEEYFNPLVVQERSLGDDEHIIHSHDPEVIEIIRERSALW